MKGKVKVYASDNPNVFNKNIPVGFANIEDGITTYITDDNITRKYFLLSFNDKYDETVSAHLVHMDSIQNFRDIGGYATKQGNRSTRWGKVFRSGNIGGLSDRDTIRMDNLKIKTIIDLRTAEEIKASPISYKQAQIIHIPIELESEGKIYDRIKEGRVRKGDGVLFMQDMYLHYMTDKSGQFAKAMKLFLDKDNYPILFNCTMGKDRVGFLSAMLLAALGVPEEMILYDYVLSNEYIDLKRYEPSVHQLSSDSQETLTVILTVDESYMDFVFKMINKEYGSVEKYLNKELNLSDKDLSILKENMLF